MSYATAADFLLAYGAAESARLASPDDAAQISAELLQKYLNGENLDEYPIAVVSHAATAVARLNRALAAAIAEVDSAIEQKYAVPFDGSAAAMGLLREMVLSIARWTLADDETQYSESGAALSPASDRARWARKLLADIRSGAIQLIPATRLVISDSPTMVFQGEDRIFTRARWTF